MTRFGPERRVFNRLKSDCSKDAKEDYERAISILVELYNTTIYENRFVVGGAVEVFTYALLRSVGIDCNLYGDQSKSGDILLPNDRKLSVKSTFTGGPTNVTLMNKRGGGTREWDTATMFIVSEVGIVFGAPDMVGPEHIRDVSDSVELHKTGLAVLIEDRTNVIEMEISRKPPTEMTGFSHKASTALARQILYEAKAKSLVSAFPPSP